MKCLFIFVACKEGCPDRIGSIIAEVGVFPPTIEAIEGLQNELKNKLECDTIIVVNWLRFTDIPKTEEKEGAES